MSTVNKNEDQVYRGVIDFPPPDFKPSAGNDRYCFVGPHTKTGEIYRSSLRVFETSQSPTLESFAAWVTSNSGCAACALKTFPPDHKMGVIYRYMKGAWTGFTAGEIQEIEKYRRPDPSVDKKPVPDLGPF